MKILAPRHLIGNQMGLLRLEIHGRKTLLQFCGCSLIPSPFEPAILMMRIARLNSQQVLSYVRNAGGAADLPVNFVFRVMFNPNLKSE